MRDSLAILFDLRTNFLKETTIKNMRKGDKIMGFLVYDRQLSIAAFTAELLH